MTPFGLVGRDRPLLTLRAALARAREGRGGLVLVTGEPGIGKTALASAAAAEARHDGWLVASAACWDGDGAPGYWPWLQVVRGCRRAMPPAAWEETSAAAGAGLAVLLGEADDRAAPDDRSGAFPVFDAAATLLTAAARTQPVVAVIDDLHWADAASLRLLDFVARHAAPLQPLLLLATSRDVEPDAALAPLLGAVAAKATVLPLGGLDGPAVAALMARAGGSEPEPGDVAEVLRRTGGNPFFVQQTVLLRDAGVPAGTISPGVRDAVERRLAAVAGDTASLLRVAAVLGTSFDLDLLAAAAGVTAGAAQKALDRAAVAGLVGRGALSGSFHFVHDLVRETLADTLGADATRQAHAAVLRAIEASPELAARTLPAQVAHHANLAVPEVPPAAALVHVLAAARDASARLAAEEAAGHLARALTLLPAGSGRQRLQLHLALGAEQQRAGDLAGARSSFEAVVADARAAGDAESLARAALGLHDLGHHLYHGDPQGLALVDQAYRALGDAHDGLRARLLAAASRVGAHSLGADRAEDEELSARAVDLARRCGDDEALGFALLARHDAIWTAGTAAARADLASEMSEVARRSGDRELALQAALLRVVALLEQGDPRALHDHAAFVAMAERAGLPRWRWLALTRQGTMAMLAGRFAEARRCIDEGLALADRLGEVDGESVWADQSWELGRLQGRGAVDATLLAGLRERGDPHAVILEAGSLVDRGDAAGALRLLPELERLGEHWPRWAWMVWLASRAEVVALSDDPERCAALRAEIEPHRESWAVLAGGVLVRGPMAHWLALLDAAGARWDDAVSGFATAARSAEALGSRTWSVLARLGEASARLGRAGAGDAAAAGELLDGVVAEATALGMGAALERARRLRPQDSAGGEAPPCAVRCDGEVWTLAFAGRVAALPDAKGLRDLHTLLARPRLDVSATELLGAAPALGADPVLDDSARADFRRRLAELDAAVDRALAGGEEATAAALERERQDLLDELRRATGLGGRARRLGDDAERARKTVTARIRDSLRRIDARHPELAMHLRSTVTTGTWCRYQPREDVPWAL